MVLLNGKKDASQLFEGFVYLFVGLFFWLYFESSLMWAVLLRMLNGVLGLVLKKTWENLQTQDSRSPSL